MHRKSHFNNLPAVCMVEIDFYEYIVGLFSPLRRRLLETHMAGCDDCREKLAAILHNWPKDTDDDAGIPSRTPDNYEVHDLFFKIRFALPRIRLQ